MRVAVLVSGAGTNLQALVDAEAQGALGPAHVALVISNRPGVAALERAAAAGVPRLVVDHKAFASREAFEDALLAELGKAQIDLVVLAGFMRVLTAHFVARFPSRIVNTHPALCPAFPGTDAPAQALAYGVRVTGCTVHFVDTGVDTGAIIFQAAVPVLPDDSATSLHDRIRVHEHALLPRAVRLLAEGRIQVTGRTVRVEA